MALPALIEVLIAQALDDLDDARLEIATALRLIAEVAWQGGYHDGRRDVLDPPAR
jgi:hypothetical protein